MSLRRRARVQIGQPEKESAIIQPEMIVLDAEQGIVECRPRRRKVAIVGAGPGREYAPYTDSAWECWSLNEIAQRDAQRHFELHPLEVQSARDLAALERITIPCYVLDDPALWKMPFTIASNGGTVSFAGVPHPVRYPLERLRAAGFREYFTCTFAYQCALAILDGFEEIGLWGVSLHLGTPRERLLERACVDYWIGFAEGRGIKVVEDSGCARRPYLYGYDYDAEKEEGDRAVARFVQVAQQMGYLDLSQVDP